MDVRYSTADPTRFNQMDRGEWRVLPGRSNLNRIAAMDGVGTQGVQQRQGCYSWSTTELMRARRPRGSLGVGVHERYEDGQIDPEPRQAS